MRASERWPALRKGLEQIPNHVGDDGGLLSLREALQDETSPLYFGGGVVCGRLH